MDNLIRDQIVAIVKKDFIGPDPSSVDSQLVQENGEEILKESPIRRYLAGILFSKNYGADEIPEEDGEEEDEDVIRLTNASYQSAMGITIAIPNNDKLETSIHSAFYNESLSSGEKLFLRIPIQKTIELLLPKKKDQMDKIEIYNDPENGRKILLDVICRQIFQDSAIYTVTLENASLNVANETTGKYCMFQCSFTLSSKNGFVALPDSERVYHDEDFESNTMLYRDEKSFGIGHGCSVCWNKHDTIVKSIWTSTFPEYEMTSIVPSVIEGVSLDMYKMSDPKEFNQVDSELIRLCDEYEKWISSLQYTKVDARDNKTKTRHIENCKACLDRMRKGVSLLESNPLCRNAFQLMNKAMLMQQLHYALPKRGWVYDGNKLVLDDAQYQQLPVVDDKKTWFGNISKYGKWRAFQLAFILINIQSMIDQQCNEHHIVDLIWFPTGGGKTEAYLGLSAYTVFIRRLLKQNDAGTAILMRYTLRLLTNQQYQRASALICSMEILRREDPVKLGDEPITIGLWVGNDSTPNTYKEAESRMNKRIINETRNNPFVILKCPWCGTEMGFSQVNKNPSGGCKEDAKPIGYDFSRRRTFKFYCPNEDCDFHSQLPLSIIDEEIYHNPPTMLIGTVDKFATLPFKPEARSLFGIGIDGSYTNSPPNLIIQDELHLISGPLGTMVGLYEGLIEGLCSQKSNGKTILSPKIIASTATISRAKEQCKALYCRKPNEVFQFPPSGISYKDSFFSKADNNSNGRKYVGIFCSNMKYSAVTANIRFYADIAFAREHLVNASHSELNAYWTHVGYFNSIRELGRMKSYVSQEVEEHMKVLNERHGIQTTIGILNVSELTSRIDNNQVLQALDELLIDYPSDAEGHLPIDVCLASNMISVGLDVPRLGLLSVAGQPKTTSEYIQATSRVGRAAVPGLVFIMYSYSKPRDISHYEQFQNYHAKIYSNVEPTSVTPYSGPVRERALGAILVAYIRLKHPEIEKQKPFKVPKDEWFEELRTLIIDRVAIIAPEENENTQRNLDKLIDEWKGRKPESFGSPFSPKDDGFLTTKGNHSKNGFVIPTSMRSVDASCNLDELKVKYGKSST